MDIAHEASPYYVVRIDRDGRYLAECASLNVQLKTETCEDAYALMAMCVREFFSPHAAARHLLRSSLIYALMATRRLNSIAI